MVFPGIIRRRPERIGPLTRPGGRVHNKHVDAAREAEAVAQVIDRLADKFPRLGRDEVEQAVRSAHGALDGAPIREYVPVLVEHDAKDRLRRIIADDHSELSMA
jgi:hypothetical protein